MIVCIGEETYAEKPGDIRDLALPPGQIEYVRAVRQKTNGKVILVFFGGRPRLLGDAVGLSDAVFVAFLPGPDGGQAVVDLIVGVTQEGEFVSPAGCLPVTYPRFGDGGGIPYWRAVSAKCTVGGGGGLPRFGYGECGVEWPFGFGLGYAAFVYGGGRSAWTKTF